MYTEITGYVGNEYVIAKVYYGSDSDLSHYIYQGKTYVGTVIFTHINSERKYFY